MSFGGRPDPPCCEVLLFPPLGRSLASRRKLGPEISGARWCWALSLWFVCTVGGGEGSEGAREGGREVRREREVEEGGKERGGGGKEKV